MVVACVLLQVVQFTGVYLSLQYGVPAGLVALLAGSSPVLVALAVTIVLDEHLRPASLDHHHSSRACAVVSWLTLPG